MEHGGFEVLNLPAIVQADQTSELSNGGVYHRKQGELLHATHETAKVLLELKNEMGPDCLCRSVSAEPCPAGRQPDPPESWLTPIARSIGCPATASS